MIPKISIIIPFLNESDNIVKLVTELNNFCSKNTHRKYEVLFIDDGSTDSSVNILKGLSHKNYNAQIIKFSKNYGSHAALRAGILLATGEYITFMYADLQDPLNLIESLCSKIETGNEIVWATRNSSKAGFYEKIFSKLYAFLMRKFALQNFPESGFDIVMFSQKIQIELNQNVEANSSIFLQILSLGYSQTFISYDRLERKAGKSKWTLSKKIKLVLDSFISFSYAPIRLVTLMGIAFSGLGFIYTAYLICRAVLVGDLESGWPVLISILMIGFGVTNISLGIIAEYLWRTLDVSRKRKVFIVDDIIDLNNEK